MRGNKRRYRIGLLGIFHESNTFLDGLTTLEDFERHWSVTGEQLLDEFRHTFHEIGGMIEALGRFDVDLVPVYFAGAVPGGTVQREAFESLLQRLKNTLLSALPMDACLVAPHGAAVAEGYSDMDGFWLKEVREILGAQTLIVGTIDPHANLSPAMVAATDALFAYQTNPHVDQYETGMKAATFLMECLKANKRPKQYLVMPPLAISIEQQHSAVYPCNMLYDRARSLEDWPGIQRVNVVLGFPYADVVEMGTTFLVVCESDNSLGMKAAKRMTRLLLSMHMDMVGKKAAVKDQLIVMESMDKPILWLDMGDNVGGGSLGDSVSLLKHAEDHGKLKTVICVFDPSAVTSCLTYSTGDSFELTLGRDYDDPGSSPFSARVTLRTVSDGKFEEASPRHGGQTRFDMGTSVLLETARGSLIVVHSLRTPPFSINQLLSMGVDVHAVDLIIAKGVNAPIAAFGPVCPSIVQADSPGVTQADMTRFTYLNRRKPMFPFEPITDDDRTIEL